MPNKPTTLATIQTIKEAEEKLIDKFSNIEIKGNILRGKCSECKNPDVLVKDSDMKAIELGVFKDFKSHITQTLLAVFESEFERHKRQKAIHKEIIATHDIAPFKWHEGRIAEAEDSIIHLTEVINYLKQK